MNLQEEIEKAFMAGADYIREEAWADEGLVEMPTDLEVKGAVNKYVNTRDINQQMEISYGGTEGE